MDTSVQLFRYDQRLTAIGLGEPSITLIENDTAFSVLLAEAARDDSHSERLHFDQVSLVRIRGKSWHFYESQLATIRQTPNGIWIVQDTLSGKLYHEQSAVPYHVIFIFEPD